MESSSPYSNRPERAFWKSGVAERHPLSLGDVYRRKFQIAKTDRITTAGSCFAQHIARHLRERRFTVLDAEPGPSGISEELRRRFGYGFYSARYGNVYTARQLRQLFEEAIGEFVPQDAVWEREGRFFDALRPSVEPEGLGSREELRAMREAHLGSVRQLLASTDVLVFTLGLTEGWVHKESGTVYPTAPGTLAGCYDPSSHAFVNFTHAEVLADMLRVREILRERQPGIRILLTVSPVPLTATATNDHVLVASTYSKSVLRGVAGELASDLDDIDYFPSYEIICGIQARSMFFDGNLRTVVDAGVEVVMKSFFGEHDPDHMESPRPKGAGRTGKGRGRKRVKPEGEVQCEEALLEAFAG